MSTDYLTSPIGEIQFMALNRKVTKKPGPQSDENPLGYSITLKFDTTTKEGKAWKDTISKINPALIRTKHSVKPSEYNVGAFTQFDTLVVLDADGNTLDTKPNFFPSSTGTAQMVVAPYTGNKLGGAINLVGVVIHQVTHAEGEEGNSVDAKAIAERIRAQIKAGH